MKTTIRLLLALAVAAVAAWYLLPREPARVVPPPPVSWIPPDSGVEPVGPGYGYLRGAHWFGEGWSANFWSTRLLEQAAEDFAALRADGFNTVVLVVPWPGFARSMTGGGLDPERVRHLTDLLDLAERSRLNVVLRIGFARDSTVPDAGDWSLGLWLEPSVRQSWLRYVAAMWRLVESRPHVVFGFISWEDLWAITRLGEENEKARLDGAVRSGYRSWLRRYSTLEVVSRRYGRRLTRWEQVPIPTRTEPAWGLFLDFVDHAWIERFFEPARERFPSLSMEVRLDSDPVWNAPGDLAYWHSHELAWDLPGAEWTTAYWSPAMGGENRGETVSARKAVERLEWRLDRLRKVTGERPVFLGRFLVAERRPGYGSDGRLESGQLEAFLELAAPVLRRLTHGYALWTWRDYRHDAVTSPDFSTDAQGWTGPAAAVSGDGPLVLAAGERLSRDFDRHAFHVPEGPDSASLCVQAAADGNVAPDLLVIAGGGRQREELDVSGTGRACLDIAVAPTTRVVLEALDDLALESINLFGHLQSAGLRDLDGAAKPVAETWRRFNAGLPNARPAPLAPYPDDWMGKTLTTTLSGSDESGGVLSFRTGLGPDWPFTPRITVRVNGETAASVPCTDGVTHELPLAPDLLTPGSQAIALTVDRTWRPDGDDRRLGCLIYELELDDP